MIRRIFSAIASVLRSIARVIGTVAAAPLRAIDWFVGGGDPPAWMPEIAPIDDHDAGADRQRAAYAELGAIIQGWAAACVIENERMIPPEVPPELKDSIAMTQWLPSLTRAECEALVNADETAVVAHLRGGRVLPGLRAVGPLPAPEPWSRPDIEVEPAKTAELIYDAASPAPAR